MSILIPCPTCSGAQTVTCEDRHTATRQDVCPTCAPYADVHPGRVPAQTGETRAASFDPAAGSELYDDDEDPGVCVHPYDGEFVVSDGGTWLPGAYETTAGARRAAECFTYEALLALQGRKNAEAGGTGGTITDADLDALAGATDLAGR